MNTDDYEGHTPGPWKLARGDPYDELVCWLNIASEHGNGFVIQECVGFSDGQSGPNVKLMVAAPDLLAEVKRLREENETLRKADWEYECLWTWLGENTDLLNTIEPLIEEWKREREGE